MYSAVSTVKEAADESESEARRSASQLNTYTKENNKDIQFEQNLGQTTAFSDNAEPTMQQETTFDDEQIQLVTALTGTIATLGNRFEEMGASFEAKLQTIEERHRELEQKLAEV